MMLVLRLLRHRPQHQFPSKLDLVNAPNLRLGLTFERP
jgi:hypothetical protein